MLWWLLFEPKCLMQRGSPPENQHATGVWSDTARSFVAVFAAVFVVVARAVLAPSPWSSPRSQTLLLPRRVLQTASSRLEVSANPPPPVLVPAIAAVSVAYAAVAPVSFAVLPFPCPKTPLRRACRHGVRATREVTEHERPTPPSVAVHIAAAATPRACVSILHLRRNHHRRSSRALAFAFAAFRVTFMEKSPAVTVTRQK